MGVSPVQAQGEVAHRRACHASLFHGRDARAPFLMWAGRPRSLRGGLAAIWGGSDAGRGRRRPRAGAVPGTLRMAAEPRLGRAAGPEAHALPALSRQFCFWGAGEISVSRGVGGSGRVGGC
jgi:hypothetical protein